MNAEAYLTRQHFAHPDESVMHLSVLVAGKSFMHAVLGADHKKVISLSHIDFSSGVNTEEEEADRFMFMVNNFRLASKKFRSVNICILNSSFTIIPLAYSREADHRLLLGFNTGLQVQKGLRHELHDVQFSYTVSPALLSAIERSFPSASLRHSGAVSLGLLFSQHSLAGKQLFIHIAEGQLELSARSSAGLLFYNVFDYSSSEDVLYYLLFMMEQFGLDPAVTRAAIAAQRPVDDDLLRTIAKYIPGAAFCVNDPSVAMPDELRQMPAHYYFTLLNQHLCEL